MVSIPNLTNLAQEYSSKTRGSRLPHAPITYTFDVNTSVTLKADDWVNKKEPLKTHITRALANQELNRAAVTTVAQQWTCDGSLLEDLLNEFYFENQAPKWFDPGGSENTLTFGLKNTVDFSTDERRYLFALLASLRAAVYYREATMAALNMLSLTVTHPNPLQKAMSTQTTVAFDWNSLFKQMRLVAKQRINGGLVPLTYNEQGTEYDTIMYDCLNAAGGGFRQLIDLGVLVRGHGGNGYDLRASKTTFLGTDKQLHKGFANGFGTAVNHARFVLYIEWRIGYELSTGNFMP